MSRGTVAKLLPRDQLDRSSVFISARFRVLMICFDSTHPRRACATPSRMNARSLERWASVEITSFTPSCGHGDHGLRPGPAARVCRVCQGRTSADQIIDEHDRAAFHFADHDVSADHILAPAFFNEAGRHGPPQPVARGQASRMSSSRAGCFRFKWYRWLPLGLIAACRKLPIYCSAFVSAWARP